MKNSLIRIALIAAILSAGLFASGAQKPKLKPSWTWRYSEPPYYSSPCFANPCAGLKVGRVIYPYPESFIALSMRTGKELYNVALKDKSVSIYDYNDNPKFIWNPSIFKQLGSNLLVFRSVNGIGKSPGGAEVILFRLSDGKRPFTKFYPKWYPDKISVNGDKILLSMFKFQHGVGKIVLLDTKSLSVTDNLVPYLSKNGPSRWFTVGRELYYFRKGAKPEGSSLKLVDFDPQLPSPPATEAQYTWYGTRYLHILGGHRLVSIGYASGPPAVANAGSQYWTLDIYELKVENGKPVAHVLYRMDNSYGEMTISAENFINIRDVKAYPNAIFLLSDSIYKITGTGPLKIQRLVPGLAYGEGIYRNVDDPYYYINVGNSFFQLEQDGKGDQTLRFLFSYPVAGRTSSSAKVLKLFASAPPNSGWPDFNVRGSELLGAMISESPHRVSYLRSPTLSHPSRKK